MMRRNLDSVESVDEADSPVEGLEEGTLQIQENLSKEIKGINIKI